MRLSHVLPALGFVAVPAILPAQESYLNLTVNDVGIAIGDAPRVTGLRINFRDRYLERVNGVNVTVWTPLKGTGTVNGVAIGVPATGARRINGLALAIAGVGAEDRIRGITIAPIGAGAGEELSGLVIAEIGAGTGGASLVSPSPVLELAPATDRELGLARLTPESPPARRARTRCSQSPEAPPRRRGRAA